MTYTRASIDRKLDVLAARTAVAKQEALRRTLMALAMAVSAIAGIWWWRRARA
jgi:hypothetical protein